MDIPPKIAFGLTGSKPVVLTITPRDSDLELSGVVATPLDDYKSTVLLLN